MNRDPVDAGAAQGPPAGEKGALPADQVLLVDDTPTNLQILHQTLRGQDYRLLVARNGEQAVEIARKARPALILLDIMMPGMDGYEVCRVLKAAPETRDIAIIFLSALDDTEAKVKGLELGAVDYVSKPFQAAEVVARVGTHLKVRRLERRVWRANAELRELNERLEDKVLERTMQLMRGRDGIIYGMAKLAEARDNETGRHLDRMSRYSELLARQLTRSHADLDEGWVVAVRTTAVLHDIGKIGIPDAVLHKPGRLDEAERRIMNRHPAIGGEALEEIQLRWGNDPYLVTATQIAAGHHEKWDGSGYPKGLAGDNIPLAARIVAVADVYDALRTQRVYKPAWDHPRARQLIVEGGGSHFDPQVVEAFRAIEDQLEAISKAWGD